MNRLIGKRKQELRPTLSDAIQNIEGRGENVDKKIAKVCFTAILSSQV